MKVYFGSVPVETVNFSGPDEWFKHGGNFYEYVLDFDNGADGDMFTLRDACGREVPVMLETLQEMIRALLIVDSKTQHLQKAMAERDTLVDPYKEYSV